MDLGKVTIRCLLQTYSERTRKIFKTFYTSVNTLWIQHGWFKRRHGSLRFVCMPELK